MCVTWNTNTHTHGDTLTRPPPSESHSRGFSPVNFKSSCWRTNKCIISEKIMIIQNHQDAGQAVLKHTHVRTRKLKLQQLHDFWYLCTKCAKYWCVGGHCCWPQLCYSIKVELDFATLHFTVEIIWNALRHELFHMFHMYSTTACF